MTARRRSVKVNERNTYDACHQAMREGTIYAWNISPKDGTWSVQSGPMVFAWKGRARPTCVGSSVWT